MSVQDDAVAAAKAEYPMEITYDVGPSPRPRVPYAQGYLAGHLRGGIERTREIIELIQEHHIGVAIFVDNTMAERHPDETDAVATEMRAKQ